MSTNAFDAAVSFVYLFTTGQAWVPQVLPYISGLFEQDLKNTLWYFQNMWGKTY